MLAQAVYLLCALTSVACAFLLFRQYRLTRGRLLLWSTWCFLCLALTNVGLFVDMIILTEINLAALRSVITLSGMLMLLYGMIRETT